MIHHPHHHHHHHDCIPLTLISSCIVLVVSLICSCAVLYFSSAFSHADTAAARAACSWARSEWRWDTEDKNIKSKNKNKKNIISSSMINNKKKKTSSDLCTLPRGHSRGSSSLLFEPAENGDEKLNRVRKRRIKNETDKRKNRRASSSLSQRGRYHHHKECRQRHCCSWANIEWRWELNKHHHR